MTIPLLTFDMDRAAYLMEYVLSGCCRFPADCANPCLHQRLPRPQVVPTVHRNYAKTNMNFDLDLNVSTQSGAGYITLVGQFTSARVKEIVKNKLRGAKFGHTFKYYV